jgi:hypothetical protein
MSSNNIIPDLPVHFQSIPDLNYFHDYMNKMFIAHQILIMRGKTEHAVDLLEKFRILQIQHIKDEEELLIPLYQKLIIRFPQGGAVEFYLHEHRQIEKFIDRLLVYLQSWTGKSSIDKNMVEQFDRCLRFKNLIDHHDARERIFLYRLLDQRLTALQQRDILDKFSQNLKKYHA